MTRVAEDDSGVPKVVTVIARTGGEAAKYPADGHCIQPGPLNHIASHGQGH